MTLETRFPTTLEEALQVLSQNPDAVIWAGGTDLMVWLHSGLMPRPESILFLEKVEALKSIRDEGETLFIGAGATHTDILAHPNLQKYAPVLCKAIKELCSPPVRNAGTIGGNLCTASPAGDTIPPLFVLEAELEVRGPDHERRLPIETFFKGPRQTALKKGELLTGIRFRKPAPGAIQHFEKVGHRKALAIAIVSLAARIELSPDGFIQKARFAWGSVGPTVQRFPAIEARIEGQPLSRELLQNTAQSAMKAVAPIDDIRASARYRRQVAGNLLLRLEQFIAIQSASGG